MRIISGPTVRVMGYQVVDELNLDEFLDDEEVSGWSTDTEVGGERLAEIAGRLCYMSFAKPRPGGNKAYLGHILESGHGSVLEHCVFNFVITGVSRSFTHELVRHRAGFGYSQLSQRFVDEKDCAFVVPPALLDAVAAAERFRAGFGDPVPSALDVIDYVKRHEHTEGYAKPDAAATAGLVWLASNEAAAMNYADLARYLELTTLGLRDGTLRRKRAREAARSVLPNCVETKIFVTANTRAIRGFVEQRGGMGADAEMRRVAVELSRMMKAEIPSIFQDVEVVEVDGVECVAVEHRKV